MDTGGTAYICTYKGEILCYSVGSHSFGIYLSSCFLHGMLTFWDHFLFTVVMIVYVGILHDYLSCLYKIACVGNQASIACIPSVVSV